MNTLNKSFCTKDKWIAFLFIFFLYNAFGQFGEPNPLTYLTYGPRDAKSADMDNDGDLDVVVAIRFNGRILWYENLGNGSFTKQHMLNNYCCSNIESIALDDFDGDGDIDVAATTGSLGQVIWIENQGTGNFDTYTEVTASAAGANAVFGSDLDGDGDVDLLSASKTDDKIAWYENLGGGSFGPQQVLSNQVDQAYDVHAADIDNDGDNDILGISFTDGELVLFENLGLSTFGPKTVLSSQVYSPYSIKTGDTNLDGFTDIIVATRNTTAQSGVTIFENTGTGTFLAGQLINPYPIECIDVHPVDLDLDGDLDILAAADESSNGPVPVDSVLYFENLGSGVFGAPQLVSTLYQYGAIILSSVWADDFNGDGYPEVLYTYGGITGNNIMVSDNLTNLTFDAAVPLTIEADGPEALWTVDLDNDSDIDLISASSRDYKLAWYPNENGALGDQVLIEYIWFHQPRNILTADFDADGDQDIVCGTYDTMVFYIENISPGNFAASTVITDQSYRTDAIFAIDLDGDLDLDLITGSILDDKIAWYANDGSGNFGPQTIIDIGAGDPANVTAFDYDGDGDNDIIMSMTNNQLLIYTNLGGSFSSSNQLGFISNPSDVVSADMDDDGLLDIVTGSTSFNPMFDRLSWFKNLGGGNFSDELVITEEFEDYMELEVKDVDGDGDLDVLAISNADNYAELAWVENLGNGNFGNKSLIDDFHFEGTSLATGDFDNDGDIDVVASSYLKDIVSWYDNEQVYQFQLRGNLFIDLNQNQQFDSLDMPFPQIGVASVTAAENAHVYSDGRYFFNYDTTGLTYTVSPGTMQLWEVVTDSLSYTITVDGSFVSVDSADFGFYPDSIVNILDVDLVGGVPRCSDTIPYWMNWSNIGTTIPYGYIELILDDSLTFYDAATPPDSIVGNAYYWSYDSLSYFSSEQIDLSIIMPDFNSIGDTITSILNVYAVDLSGTVIYLQSDTLEEINVCAYDPNDKLGFPEGMGSSGYVLTTQEYLEYTVRFQNTGNLEATTVKITDQLDPNLQWNTFSMLSSSHFQFYTIDTNGLLTVTFNNIFLPDSSADFAGSQGYFKYRIDLVPNLAAGTIINNSASIFFDFNPAVVTNSTTHTLFDCIDNLTTAVDQVLCMNEQVQIAPTFTFNQYNWSITNVASGSGNGVNWVADTSGSFVMDIQVSNEMCVNDTSISISVLPVSPVEHLDTTIICYGSSALIFSQVETQAGVYYDTLPAINGCDSILAKHLVVLPEIPVNMIDTLRICPGDSIIVFTEYETLNTIYYDTVSTINGCDSINSIMVTYNPTYTATEDTLYVCDGDSILVFGQYTNIAGGYTDSLQSINGCDSIISIQLLPVLNYQQPVDSMSICTGDSILVFNNYISVSGNYIDTMSTIYGCDSIVQVNVTVEPLPQVSFASNLTDSICVYSSDVALSGESPSGGVFTGAGISGSSFSPSQAGTGEHSLFYSFTDNNNCIAVDTFVVYVGACAHLTSLQFDEVVIYPNPFDDILTVELANQVEFAEIHIYDIMGRHIESSTLENASNKTMQLDAVPGYYLVILTTASGTMTRKVLKE